MCSILTTHRVSTAGVLFGWRRQSSTVARISAANYLDPGDTLLRDILLIELVEQWQSLPATAAPSPSLFAAAEKEAVKVLSETELPQFYKTPAYQTCAQILTSLQYLRVQPQQQQTTAAQPEQQQREAKAGRRKDEVQVLERPAPPEPVSSQPRALLAKHWLTKPIDEANASEQGSQLQAPSTFDHQLQSQFSQPLEFRAGPRVDQLETVPETLPNVVVSSPETAQETLRDRGARGDALIRMVSVCTRPCLIGCVQFATKSTEESAGATLATT